MTKEQTLTIIQKTNKKANSIDVVETIKNGQNIKEINSLYIAQPMNDNTLPYFWEELLENAEDKEKEYWNIINKHLETGIFIGLAMLIIVTLMMISTMKKPKVHQCIMKLMFVEI